MSGADVTLTDDELELVVGVLATHALECRQRIAAKARNVAAASTPGALRELVAAAELARRLSLELAARRAPASGSLAAAATCAECGGRGSQHESDCDLRPVQP
jgi:hypothetical protein